MLCLCNWTRAVWFGIDLGYRIDRRCITTFARWFEEITELGNISKQHRVQICYKIALTCWNIWKDRCSSIYRKEKLSPMKCLKRIRIAIMEIGGGINKSGKFQESAGMESNKWTKPDTGWYKINVDGAYEKGQKARIGVIVRDENGKVVNGIAKKVTIRSAAEVEAIAIKEGVELASVNNYKQIVIETDSEVVYKEITREKGKLNWRIYPVIKEIQRKSMSFQGFKCCWVNRTANKAADWIAKQTRKEMSVKNWVNMPPSSLVHILNRDGLPAPP